MKTVSSNFAIALAKEEGTFCTMFLVTRTDGFVFAATDHDVDIVFDTVTYVASSGYIVTDIESKSDLNPDNLEITGMLTSPAITEDDLIAGKWDYASYRVFQVNWADLTQGAMKERAGKLGKVTIQRDQFVAELRGLMENYRTVIGRIVSPTCDANLGDSRCKVRMNPPVWQPNTAYALANGSFDGSVGSIVSPTTPNGFIFYCGTPGTSGSTEPSWTLINGGVTVDGSVDWQSFPAFTVTGAITGVNADQVTLYDSSRTEPGPTGGIAITGITNANPGVVTLASTPDPAFTDLEIVSISGVLGMDPVNAVTVVHNPSGNTFSLGTDTTETDAYPPYTGGGVVTPMGGTAGRFDNGTITFTSGANNGRSQDIVYYDVGRFTLFLPMPFPVSIGDTYVATAGCDKSLQTCRDRFFNQFNFRGSPYVPGLDKIVQVGRRAS